MSIFDNFFESRTFPDLNFFSFNLESETKFKKKKLKSSPGPVETGLYNSMKSNRVKGKAKPIKVWVGHDGSFNGTSAYNLLQSKTIPLVLQKQSFPKFNDSSTIISVGNNMVAEYYIERANILEKEMKLASSTRTLCNHMKEDLKILNSEIGRHNHVLFPNHVVLLSEHFRTHIFENLDKYGDVKASERGTERMNQTLINIQEQTKRIQDKRQRADKVAEILQITREANPIPMMFTKSKSK